MTSGSNTSSDISVSSNKTLIYSMAGLGAALILAFTLIIIFYEGDKTLALAGLVTIAGLIVPQIMTFKSSTENAVKITHVAEDLSKNTEKTNATFKLVDGQMTEFKRLMKLYADSEAARVGAEQKAEGIVVGQNTPVAEPDPTLAIDPTLKKAAKPNVGDKQ